jgi:hypothetical protein
MVAMAPAPRGERNPPQLTKGQLSPRRARFVELMQDLNFGRIEHLTIVDGEPVFDPPPTVTEDLKFGGEHGPRPESNIGDFALKVQVVELFFQFDRLGTAGIDVIVVKHGLPFSMSREVSV